MRTEILDLTIQKISPVDLMKIGHKSFQINYVFKECDEKIKLHWLF